MKTNLIMLSLLCVCLVSIFSCEKGELLQAKPTKVVKLIIDGSTTEDLEFVYKDSVIAESKGESGGRKFYITALLKITSEEAEVKVRKKGSVSIIKTQPIKSLPFDQTISIYYDGTKIYNGAVDYQIKGYAISGELEFLLDGQVIASGSGEIENNISFGIDKNSTRKIEVRIKGGTAILATKTISNSPAKQTLRFLFDGSKIVDNIQLNPPLNPSNMAINAKFETTLPNLFNGKDVDLVFYTKNYQTEVVTKVTPELRFTLPVNGKFASFELPPLPDNTSFYTYDIYEKGTNNVPYDLSKLSPIFPIHYPNVGQNGQLFFGERNGVSIFHDPGTSKLLLIKDVESNVFSPDQGTMFYGEMKDLSKYFQ